MDIDLGQHAVVVEVRHADGHDQRPSAECEPGGPDGGIEGRAPRLAEIHHQLRDRFA